MDELKYEYECLKIASSRRELTEEELDRMLELSKELNNNKK